MKHNKIGLTLICIVSMLSSCVQGNLYELYDDIDMELSLNRIKRTKESAAHITNAPGAAFFEISENVFISSYCALNALSERLPQIKRKFIKEAMESLDDSIEAYPIQLLDDVIEILNDCLPQYSITCSSVNVNDIQVGDIAVTHVPLTLSAIEYGIIKTKTSSVGHCFVVDEVITNGSSKLFLDDDDFLYFKMDKSYFQGGWRITLGQ
ncbi:MAG: hypothetical protein ACSW76_01365 [Bacteroidaceae bacterium]